MAETKLKGSLPKDDEANGLGGPKWATRLVGDPELEHVAIVTYKTADIKITPSAGLQTPTVQLTRIEPVEDEAEAEVLRQKLAGFADVRLGRVPLPPSESGAKVTQLPSVLDVTDPDGGDAA
jgi:hypothetical protein